MTLRRNKQTGVWKGQIKGNLLDERSLSKTDENNNCSLRDNCCLDLGRVNILHEKEAVRGIVSSRSGNIYWWN